MNYSDYQQRIKEFAVYPRIGNNLSYAVLGLINEFGEFLEKISEFDSGSDNAYNGIKDEGGDCHWYLGTIYNEIGEDWSDILTKNAAFYEGVYNTIRHALENETELVIVIGGLSIVFGKLAGFAKKAERENNGNLLDKHRKEFIKILFIVQATLDCLLKEYSISLQDVMKGNLSKLQSRKERNVLHGDGDNR